MFVKQVMRSRIAYSLIVFLRWHRWTSRRATTDETPYGNRYRLSESYYTFCKGMRCSSQPTMCKCIVSVHGMVAVVVFSCDPPKRQTSRIERPLMGSKLKDWCLTTSDRSTRVESNPSNMWSDNRELPKTCWLAFNEFHSALTKCRILRDIWEKDIKSLFQAFVLRQCFDECVSLARFWINPLWSLQNKYWLRAMTDIHVN